MFKTLFFCMINFYLIFGLNTVLFDNWLWAHLNCKFLTLVSKSACPAVYCSMTSFTSYGFNASRNFLRAEKYCSYIGSYEKGGLKIFLLVWFLKRLQFIRKKFHSSSCLQFLTIEFHPQNMWFDKRKSKNSSSAFSNKKGYRSTEKIENQLKFGKYWTGIKRM